MNYVLPFKLLDAIFNVIQLPTYLNYCLRLHLSERDFQIHFFDFVTFST